MRTAGKHVKAIDYQNKFEIRLAKLAAEKERKKEWETKRNDK